MCQQPHAPLARGRPWKGGTAAWYLGPSRVLFSWCSCFHCALSSWDASQRRPVGERSAAAAAAATVAAVATGVVPPPPPAPPDSSPWLLPLRPPALASEPEDPSKVAPTAPAGATTVAPPRKRWCGGRAGGGCSGCDGAGCTFLWCFLLPPACCCCCCWSTGWQRVFSGGRLGSGATA